MKLARYFKAPSEVDPRYKHFLCFSSLGKKSRKTSNRGSAYTLVYCPIGAHFMFVFSRDNTIKVFKDLIYPYK